ncbi:NAD(P)H-binding protein [Anderseniella sp. Alg231-50]|uniref:NAD(P)H-binding protein n=1 Tax=Anderseniella sp. Alg231-50 TaxID=1922226 RepID=UPI00307CA90B
MDRRLNIVMLGATGAVGTEVVSTLVKMPELARLTLLGRRPVEGVAHEGLRQHNADIFGAASYAEHLDGHTTAICTLGVGEPSKVSREDFVRIDKLAVLDFAAACRKAGVKHFQLLGSIGSDSRSRSFFLRTKGELEDALRALDFERLSLFQPSMILTPENRYGLTQALTLWGWPKLNFLLTGPRTKYRGIKVATLGTAIALNARLDKSGVETLRWDDFHTLAD